MRNIELAAWLLFVLIGSVSGREAGIVEQALFADLSQAMTPDGLLVEHERISTLATAHRILALCIGAEQGWIMRETAAARTHELLQALRNLPRQQGFWAEVYDVSTREAVPESSAHTRSTATLSAALLAARAFYDAPEHEAEAAVRALADELHGGVNWRFMVVDRETRSGRVMAGGWTEREGFAAYRLIEAQTDLGDGMLAWLLAISSPSFGVDPALWYEAWTATYRWKDADGEAYIAADDATAYLTAHLWLNLAWRRDRVADYGRITTTALRVLPLRPRDMPFVELWNSMNSPGAEDGLAVPSGAFLEEKGLLLGLAANRRNGLVWRLFMGSPEIARAMDQIGFQVVAADFEVYPHGGPAAVFELSPVYTAVLSSENPRQGHYALELAFDKRAGGESAFHLRPSFRDFTDGRYLALRAHGTDRLSIRLADASGKSLALPSAIRGPATQDGWRSLYFPIPPDGGDVDLAAISRVSLEVEPGTDMRGTCRLDDLRVLDSVAIKPPPAPARLSVSEGHLPGELLLRWEEPVVPGGSRPFAFHVRFSLSPIRDEAAFQRALALPGAPGAGFSSSVREWLAAGLPTGRPLYLAIRSEDLHGHYSPLAFFDMIQLPDRRPPPEVSIDHFDQTPPRLVWEASSDALRIGRVTDVSLEGEGSLEVSYRKTRETDRMANFSARLDVRNIARFNFLSMWVAGRTELQVRLIDAHGRHQDSPVLTANSLEAWAPIFVDLSRFDKIDRAAIERIAILVEPARINVEGTFFLDSIGLSVTRN